MLVLLVGATSVSATCTIVPDMLFYDLKNTRYFGFGEPVTMIL